MLPDEAYTYVVNMKEYPELYQQIKEERFRLGSNYIVSPLSFPLINEADILPRRLRNLHHFYHAFFTQPATRYEWSLGVIRNFTYPDIMGLDDEEKFHLDCVLAALYEMTVAEAFVKLMFRFPMAYCETKRRCMIVHFTVPEALRDRVDFQDFPLTYPRFPFIISFDLYELSSPPESPNGNEVPAWLTAWQNLDNQGDMDINVTHDESGINNLVNQLSRDLNGSSSFGAASLPDEAQLDFFLDSVSNSTMPMVLPLNPANRLYTAYREILLELYDERTVEVIESYLAYMEEGYAEALVDLIFLYRRQIVLPPVMNALSPFNVVELAELYDQFIREVPNPIFPLNQQNFTPRFFDYPAGLFNQSEVTRMDSILCTMNLSVAEAYVKAMHRFPDLYRNILNQSLRDGMENDDAPSGLEYFSNEEIEYFPRRLHNLILFFDSFNSKPVDSVQNSFHTRSVVYPNGMFSENEARRMDYFLADLSNAEAGHYISLMHRYPDAFAKSKVRYSNYLRHCPEQNRVALELPIYPRNTSTNASSEEQNFEESLGSDDEAEIVWQSDVEVVNNEQTGMLFLLERNSGKM